MDNTTNLMLRAGNSDNSFNVLGRMNITICLKIRVDALLMHNKIVVYHSFGMPCNNQFCSLLAIKSVDVGYGGVLGC
jgi:hypothetical protein